MFDLPAMGRPYAATPPPDRLGAGGPGGVTGPWQAVAWALTARVSPTARVSLPASHCPRARSARNRSGTLYSVANRSTEPNTFFAHSLYFARYPGF